MIGAALGQKLSDCGREWANATMHALPVPGGVHPATAVAGCARMAGTFAFRSMPRPAQAMCPGDVMLSKEATEQSEMLIQATANILASLKVAIADRPPEAPAAPNERARREFLDTQRVLEPVFEPGRLRHDFTFRQAAQAAAVATALLIHHFSRYLDPNVAFALAAYSIIEGCKTAPDPVVVARPSG